MSVIEQSIDLDVPIELAYRQWSRFEDFPRFMEGVVSVQRVSEGRLRWHACICGNMTAWDARVVEDIPPVRLSWRSEDGLISSGAVTLNALGEGRTCVKLRVEYNPEDVLKAIGYKLGAGSEQIKRDLECFKEITEDIAEEAAVAKR